MRFALLRLCTMAMATTRQAARGTTKPAAMRRGKSAAADNNNAERHPKRMSSSAAKIKSTAKTKNLQVALPPSYYGGEEEQACTDLPGVDWMQDALIEVGTERMGLYVSHTTVLGRKRYPGNRHWHFKRRPSEPGCLDVTYWPQGPALWVSVRNCEPAWVGEAGIRLVEELESYLEENKY